MAEEPITGSRPATDLLAQIQEGMPVYDASGKSVGKVTSVFMGAAADTQEHPGVVPGTTFGTLPTDEDGAFGEFGDLVDPDGRIPDVLRRRLRYNGFIRIDSGGLLKSFRYALREHIAQVAGDRVQLNIVAEELIRS
jgi:hypothetical protein